MRSENEHAVEADIVYRVNEAVPVQSISNRFSTLNLRDSGNFMKFQLDIEADVVPLSLYMKATGDVKLKNVM